MRTRCSAGIITGAIVLLLAAFAARAAVSSGPRARRRRRHRPRAGHRGLAIYEQVDNDHLVTATSITGLAQVHSTRAQYDEALRLYAYALAILEASLGPDHPSVTHALNGLGETHRAVGRAAEAIALLERALATRAVSSVQSEELAESRPRRPDEPASSPSRRCEATPRRSARSASGPRSARGWRPL